MKGNITSIHSSKYLRRRRQITGHRTPSLGWVWLLTGIFIGIISVIAIHSGMHPQTLHKFKRLASSKETPLSVSENKPSHPETKSKSPITPQATAPKYEFYTLLPGMEVQLPSTSPVISTPVKPPATTNPTKPKVMLKKALPKTQSTQTLSSLSTENAAPKIQSKLAAAHYIIQAGVFALPSDAKELAKHLITKGFQPRLHKVKMRNGVTAYRVILGPYPTEVVALHHKKQLEEKKIRGILILKR